jgi:cytochrome P450
MDPGAHELINDEIARLLGDMDITHELLGQLEVSRNLFAEGLRLYPPVPFITRDLTEQTSMRDWIMKKGSLVVVSPWLIHRHKQFWKNPDSFIAKRFARGQKEKVDKRAYLPFGIGPRVCPGAAFALMEGPLILASLFQKFEFEIESHPDLHPVCRLTTRPSHPIYMEITDRK